LISEPTLAPTLVITTLLVLVTIGIHYEGLYLVASLLERMRVMGRPRVGLAVLGAMLAHVAEILGFALGIQALLLIGQGALKGVVDGFLDIVYFSFNVYTTLGFGDIVPTGYLRLLIGVESVSGLVMIAWTASFSFMQMQRYWGRD
jgi:hypothetical protein